MLGHITEATEPLSKGITELLPIITSGTIIAPRGTSIPIPGSADIETLMTVILHSKAISTQQGSPFITPRDGIADR